MFDRNQPIVYSTDDDGNITEVFATMGELIDSGWWDCYGNYNDKPIVFCPEAREKHDAESLENYIENGKLYPLVFSDGETYKGLVIGVSEPIEENMADYVFFKEENNYCVVYTLADD